MMISSLFTLLKKDFKMMLSGKFFLLALGSLLLYSCYIQFVYVNLDQKAYPVFLYDPNNKISAPSKKVTEVKSLEELKKQTTEGEAIGVNAAGSKPLLIMDSSGRARIDTIRAAYALALLTDEKPPAVQEIGRNNKDMKNRREITSEFLFFELAAVGFLGIASIIFKEKHMGVIRIHGVMPISKSLFILSKLFLFLAADNLFAYLLTVINLGHLEGFGVIPAVLLQTTIMSLIMTLIGIICAIRLPDFKQFSLLYLVLAVFVTTPVFLAGQTGMTWNWIHYHPLYHLFMAMKNAYFQVTAASNIYYGVCLLIIILLFLLARKVLSQEMVKEG
ncbi:ABC transporter permease [Candidatus Enterococcus murrayae]|uniref:ABC transporter permease n=1 Tax=Candidatus Enterococcus murrayae TaxID=2815321 RepID=A0ABS3HF92_9ENTE|nr:ABC transporter permease [Enterococcus sp. MJM16]MBO0452107.1 ABC transporter permease [Enterococcus sp. MJM16]